MQETLDIKDYLQIALRRKWYFIVPFVLISIAAIAYALYAPNIYRASTLILVEPQKVPSSYVKATVTEDIESQLRTITEQIMSRSYLEKIINEFDLYPEMRKKLPLQSVIERMRRCIDVRVRKGRVFTVSFEDQNPVIAMKVANRLASLFIEGNLKVREERAEGTLVFLEKELERVRKLLKQQEKKVSEFRAEHLGVLPEQLEANLRTLDRLQLQLQSNGEALKAAEETRRMLQQQLSQMQTMPMITVDEPTSGEEIVSESSSLSELKAKLKKLRLRYTEKHPEVVRLERLIAQMENEEKSNEANEEGSKETSANEEPLWASQIEAQLAQLDAELSQLKNERKRLKSEIKEYERRVEITPKVEQQLKELSRGYEVTQKEYQSLLDKKLQAELAANMERKQKGERFKVLDQAKIPERPFKPNRQKIILFGVFLGMAIGGGLVGVVEYLDHSFYKIEDLEQFTGISVIASIPKIKAKKLAEV